MRVGGKCLPRYFNFGLVSFLGAHIAYSIAFYHYTHGFNLILIAPVLLLGLVYYGFLFKELGKEKLPVLIYILAISMMVFLALNSFIHLRNMSSFLMFFGALSFAISDVILAWDKFKHQLKHEPILVMGSYYLAQLLIASSVLYLYHF